MTRSKKAPAVQQFIDSLLDDDGNIIGEQTKSAVAERHEPMVIKNVTPDVSEKTIALGGAQDTSDKSENTVNIAAKEHTKEIVSEVVSVVDRRTATDINVRSAKAIAERKLTANVGHVLSSAEASLKQSENLRIAQSRITELEADTDRLRQENERLAGAGETLRRRVDELLARTESLETQMSEQEKIFSEEKKVLKGQLNSKEREVQSQTQKVDQLENRLENNFKKIRVRERELEHRLEIIKMENQTLVASKDKMILDLKRQIDQLAHESDYSKQKSQEFYNQFRDKQDTIRRVVRALRIALTILEGDDEGRGNVPLKKAE